MFHRLSTGLFVAVPLLFSASLAAQGSDNCATATAIAGVGSFAFNNSTATTGPEGQTNALCLAFGNTAVQRDVWFTWTSNVTDNVDVATCGLTGVDTKIAVYAGSGCPSGAPLACNDDNCNFQSRVNVPVVTGNTYTIQIGVFPNAQGGSGQFSVGVAVPPPPCGVNTGPDVIVGDLIDVMNVTSVGGIDAVALGTTSCNIGTQVLLWQSGTSNHPVIRQNVYKYKVVEGAGRFEQVGLSWLKHAFAAVSGNLCCTCQGGGGGLGVGCSDPYGSGLNGNQSSAGPNWQVNAHTGGFPYPPANTAPWSGVVARRCQIKKVELEPTGGGNTTRFFGEGHYVTPDDAAAGNQNNNASWREMSCTLAGVEHSLQLTGATVREDPAIRAWAVAETGVTLNDVQIPNDGLVIVGSKGTNLLNGTWRYEFAVFNLNADRNVGAFSVPVPAGVEVTNIGFHDVDYHDGDGNGSVNFSATDWVGVRNTSSVSWACEAQIVNNNANAIRWGTLYNFRFDADAGPVSGVLTLGLWKPGTPTEMTTTGDVPGNAAFSAFCLGDGTGSTACPCGNTGAPGHGCANSTFASGAELTALGSPSIASDNVLLSTQGVTGPWVVFFQGDTQVPPLVIDDGIGCVGGTLVRLGSQAVGGGSGIYPDVGDPSLSVRGGIAAPGTYFYQAFYRNNATTFCPPATSNRTNGLVVTWAP